MSALTCCLTWKGLSIQSHQDIFNAKIYIAYTLNANYSNLRTLWNYLAIKTHQRGHQQNHSSARTCPPYAPTLEDVHKSTTALARLGPNFQLLMSSRIWLAWQKQRSVQHVRPMVSLDLMQAIHQPQAIFRAICSFKTTIASCCSSLF